MRPNHSDPGLGCRDTAQHCRRAYHMSILLMYAFRNNESKPYISLSLLPTSPCIKGKYLLHRDEGGGVERETEGEGVKERMEARRKSKQKVEAGKK